MNILIRQLSSNEILLFLQKVDSQFVPFPLSMKVDLKGYSEKLSNYAVHFIVEDVNQMVGMCCCYINDPQKEKAFISVTCIEPHFFGRGLGKALTHECEKYVQKQGFKFIEFEVHIENIPSINMHKAIGYYIDRQEKDSFYMKKAL